MKTRPVRVEVVKTRFTKKWLKVKYRRLDNGKKFTIRYKL